MRIKKDDLVIILSGKERGMTGRVLKVMPNTNRVLVEGRNVVQRHVKAGAMGQQESAIVPKEASIHASNIALYSEQAGRGVRVRSRFVGRDGQLFPTRQQASASFGEDQPKKIQKVRVSPQTGERFD